MKNHPTKTIIINLIGEPGCGKSFLSFWLTQRLKEEDIIVELVPEIVKYECHSDAGKARVRSGKYDFRYLKLQSALIFSLMNNVEVIINDGALEAFWLYALGRISNDSKESYEKTILEKIEHIKANTESSLYVMPKRLQSTYETVGRNENEEESRQLRYKIIDFVEDRNETIIHLSSYADREKLVEQIKEKVIGLRLK